MLTATPVKRETTNREYTMTNNEAEVRWRNEVIIGADTKITGNPTTDRIANHFVIFTKSDFA
jgi:hypothetical protein